MTHPCVECGKLDVCLTSRQPPNRWLRRSKRVPCTSADVIQVCFSIPRWICSAYYLTFHLRHPYFSQYSIPFTDFQPKTLYKMPVDLLNPSPESEAQTHKLKRLVQSPNSFFMDIKCPGCFQITTVFSHAQTVVVCGSCNVMLCQPTGGRARLTEGCSYRKKVD